MTEQQLPESWQMVKFGDIAKHISKRVEPSETDLEIYVGLEHLDPDSLKVKRHGVPSDVAGQKLLVKKGQIIFGKRRAYQRKVAVADWDCICSAHAMVLEPINKWIVSDYLPVFMQSDEFMSRAISISEGSLSPTIKWKVLENQTFLIPSRDSQLDCVTRYKTSTRVLEKIDECVASAKVMALAVLNEKIKKLANKKYMLSDISKVIRGASPRPKGDPRYYGGSVPRLMTEDMNRDGKFVYPKIDSLTIEGAKKSRLIKKGTLVLICSGGPTTVGKPSILGEDACIHDGIFALADLDESVCRPEFLYYLLLKNQSVMNKNATHGGVFVNLTTDILKKMELEIPPLSDQDSILTILNNIDEIIHTNSKKIVDLKIIRSS
ncbi:restriction endonuclease subunit S [Shewanella baltica]|uniref:restriction endonuclease subunit S n=1 Tax=Shewanella baltica TaxID=62322 RepID=UPI00217ED767|nr:restriction endonuclease subunit S [Shewanella baltica]MCS6129188.1 restriction endonuclease subunit S [Shewanella baltica]MCS6141118.1 restriction endonuclease subunit S [Shewanella baltica]MCS6147402.1 restriction endonuclease subunit S [Shewanella baltica]MCS6171931.1 restriction endonuclease subunit S [Shewanella baltica]MCS6189156.1 restriction endonuclease subunit S [Shewanella baltica]